MGGNRTRDRAFAELGLTTWLPRLSSFAWAKNERQHRFANTVRVSSRILNYLKYRHFLCLGDVRLVGVCMSPCFEPTGSFVDEMQANRLLFRSGSFFTNFLLT